MGWGLLECPTVSNDIQQYPTISNDIQRYPTISNNIPRYPTISHDIQRYPTISNDIRRYPTISNDIQRYPTISNDKRSPHERKCNTWIPLRFHINSISLGFPSRQELGREASLHMEATGVHGACFPRMFLGIMKSHPSRNMGGKRLVLTGLERYMGPCYPDAGNQISL